MLARHSGPRQVRWGNGAVEGVEGYAAARALLRSVDPGPDLAYIIERGLGPRNAAEILSGNNFYWFILVCGSRGTRGSNMEVLGPTEAEICSM